MEEAVEGGHTFCSDFKIVLKNTNKKNQLRDIAVIAGLIYNDNKI